MAFNIVHTGCEEIYSVSYLSSEISERKEGEIWDVGRKESHVPGKHMCNQGFEDNLLQ